MLRGGRFGESMDSDAAEYTASIEDDFPLFEPVVEINMAHVHMLRQKDIIDGDSADEILEALLDLHEEGFETLDLRPELEDIHMVVEEYLIDEVGEEVGGKLHTAKSRNDQVAAAVRMVLREEILDMQEMTANLVDNLVELARDNTDTVMPGYTHLQVAEPTTFAHYLSAYGEIFLRDLDRLESSYEKTDLCPLGACAFAGTSFPIDRDLTGDLLGFGGILENTMDAVGSRDFALQVMSTLAITMSGISRLAEEIVLWSSAEFDMVEVPDEFSSTSSVMPQKKNPVVAEIGRAKSGRALGDLIGGLAIMKNLPQAYSLDLQDLTPLLWDSVGQTKSSLNAMGKLVAGLEPNPESMEENAQKGLAAMTEIANTIVRESGVPFRKAHEIVGKLAAGATEEDKTLNEISFEDLQEASEEITGSEIDVSEDSFDEALDLSKCVERRKVVGGPSPESVEEELSGLEDRVKGYRERIKERRESLSESKKKLIDICEGD